MTAAANPAGERRRWIAFGILVAAVLTLPWLGKGPLLLAIVLACALFGVPLFALIGIVTMACFLLWAAGMDDLSDLGILVERIRSLADTENLLAVPLFMLSGAIMSRGQISVRLIEFSKSLIGWIPGGLAVSAVLACMLFAAISGSSPATVVAIGAMMGPSLIKSGYPEKFSHGLLTSSGSLGILIPPSIPMIIYPLVNQSAAIETERMFAAGFGPGFVIGGILGAFCIYEGLRSKSARQSFTLAGLRTATSDGLFSLLFPLLILGGIYSGFFTVVEASAVSVVYAIVVEIWVHRAIKVSEVPKVVQETGVILGSLLVIMVAALSFSEFLEDQRIPHAAVEWIRSLDLSPITFLIILNLLLLMVGMFMDILSAMFVFVPLLAPIAASMGVDPIHFGIIFIVNLEIGYLTPPVGLNLFVASTLFNRPLGHIVRSVGPFIALMAVGLLVITYVPAISIGLGDWIVGGDEQASTPTEPTPVPTDGPLPLDEPPTDTPADPPPSGDGPGGMLSMEEMMRLADEGGDGGVPAAPEAPAPSTEQAPSPPPLPNRVMTMEEMMEAAEQRP